MPWNTLLGELSECLKADYGEESTGSQASDADGIIPKMRRILLQLMGSCTRDRKQLQRMPRNLFANQSMYHAFEQILGQSVKLLVIDLGQRPKLFNMQPRSRFWLQ